jgi:hypothetical protein
MAFGWKVALVAGAAIGAGCAHGSKGQGSGSPLLSVGHYQVESIRSHATLDGVDRVIEISEAGTRLVDSTGGEHLLTERGALTLGPGGQCRLALAVSVDGDEPGISDRPCTWELQGEVFYLGDGRGEGPRTSYRVRQMGERLVLDGLREVGPEGQDMGDASGERIVLMHGRWTAPPADRANEQARTADGPEMTNDM